LKRFAPVLGLGALALAVSAPPGLGGGSAPLADGLDRDYQRTLRFSGDELEPAGARQRALMGETARARKQAAKLKYYIGTEFQIVASGDAQLFEVRCPAAGDQPLTGGVFATTSGLVISNSSRTSPVPAFPTHSRAWYEAVYNPTGAQLAWKPFLTCMRV